MCVDSLDAAVTAGVVGARGDFADAQKFVDCGRDLGAEVRAVVREQCRGTAPDGDEAVDENVGRSLGIEFRFGDGEHVGTAAAAVREEGVGVSSSRGRKGTEEVDTDRDARAIRQWNGQSRPAYRLA